MEMEVQKQNEKDQTELIGEHFLVFCFFSLACYFLVSSQWFRSVKIIYKYIIKVLLVHLLMILWAGLGIGLAHSCLLVFARSLALEKPIIADCQVPMLPQPP